MKILIGIDKTEESQIALKYACQLMEHFEAEVDAVYVQPNVTEMLADGSHALFVSKNDLAQAIDQGNRTGGRKCSGILRNLYQWPGSVPADDCGGRPGG